MEVGGDWYAVVQLPNGQVGLAIGDVAGQGCEPTRPSCQPTAGVGDRDTRLPRPGPGLRDGPARQRGASSTARGGARGPDFVP
jgi:hypothetical protein